MGTVERAGDDHTSELKSGEEQLLKGAYTRNEMLAAITNRLHAEALASLPPNVRRRIRGLRSLQKEFVDIEAKFYSEVHAIECKYEKLYKPLFEKRAAIVNGTYEPTEEECLNPWRDESEEEELAKAVANAAITEGDAKEKPPAIEEVKPAEPPMDPNVKGIPDFWFTIFRNVSMLCEMMQEHDEPILKTLQDIKVQMHEDPIGFTLEFHFAPNDYFTDTILTKEYSMKCKPDEDNPLEFEGPEIYSCKGCEINWKKGKNVTVKTIKKKQKHKSRRSVRTVTKSVQADSFFNFFSPPTMPEDPNSTLASDIQALLIADFEIGHYIRERVVSRAVLLYTGEGLDEDDDDDYEEEMQALQQKRTLAFGNHCVMTNVQCLNNVMQVCEEKLMLFEQKLDRVDAAMVLLESKILSVPEVSAFVTEAKEAPAQVLEPIVSATVSRPEYGRLVKMVQVGVPLQAAKIRCAIEGLNPDVLAEILGK